MFAMKSLAFTDGASKGNPGPGGWGAIVLKSNQVIELGGGEKHTTNNRMELAGALAALVALNGAGDVRIYTDSSYVVKGMTQWINSWVRKGWKTQTGADVSNKDLWEKLKVASSKAGKVEWVQVAGHVGIPGNERADIIASGFAEGEAPPLLKVSLKDYPVNLMDFSEPKAGEKAERSNRSKSPAYSYLSMINGDIKIVRTWKECEARVKGVKGAKFKKALSPREEEDIIKQWRGSKN